VIPKHPLTIFGHEEAKQLLRTLRTHTLLFVGPPRVGRRRVARWYAALLNCLEPRGGEPCGTCESCRLFASTPDDPHPDYREVAPERETRAGRRSRRPQIRIGDLVRRDNDTPNPLGPWLEARPRFRVRVGVIDGADTLGEGAANAFLKFLEEPPSYAVIILIAPSVQSVLPTLVSRSTPVRFGAVDVAVTLPEPHPAARLGRAGDLLDAAAHPDAFTAQMEVVHQYLLGLEKGLEEALERADALEKAWSEGASTSVAELLRARLSAWPPGHYARALHALEACEEALAAYAAPSVAVQVLTLELREVLRG
jgi:DNA polymerase-3 subunit delta'